MARPVQPDGRIHGVVVAVRRDDGRWLMVRRSRHVQPRPRAVCFPGGALEEGESQAQAVVREMREELGVEVRPLRQCWRADYENWDCGRALTLWGWTAQHVAGEPTANPAEIEEVLWLTADEGADHPEGLASNREFLACLR